MKFQKMLKKLFHYFNSWSLKHKPDNIYSICVSIKSDLELDIKLLYPNISDINIDDIPNIAEKYAELLVYVNSGIFKNKITKLIEDKSYNSSDIKDKLFFDNVISFYDFIKAELQKNSTINSPLIRPISVFNIK